MFNPFARTYSQQEKEIMNFLRKNPIFKDLSNEELLNFIPHLHQRSYGKNEVVFFRNDPSQALYLLKKGRVALQLDIDDSFEPLALLKSGMHFGENALLPRSHRLYNAICKQEDNQLYILPQVSLMEIFEENTKLKSKVMQALASLQQKQIQSIFAFYREDFGFFELGRAYYSFLEEEEEENNKE